MRAALYCRVSTLDQVADLQERELKDFARRTLERLAAFVDAVAGRRITYREVIA